MVTITPGTLDLSVLRLVQDSPVAGEALFDAQTVNVGIGVGYAYGDLLFGDGEARMTSLNIGGDHADRRGYVRLSNTVVDVSDALSITGPGGSVTNYVGSMFGGLSLLNADTNAHSITNMTLVFLEKPKMEPEDGDVLWGLKIAGSNTIYFTDLTNSGAVAWDVGRLPLLYQDAFGVYYSMSRNETYIGVSAFPVSQGTVFIIR